MAQLSTRVPSQPSAPSPDAFAATRSSRFSAKQVLVVADLVTTIAALWLAVWMTRWFPNIVVRENRGDHYRLALFTAPVWPMVFANQKLYSVRFVTRVTEEARRIGQSCLVGTILLTFFAAFTNVPFSRSWVAAVFGCTFMLLNLERTIARHLFKRLRTGGNLLRPVVVVGGNLEGMEIVNMLETDRALGYEVRAHVDDELTLGRDQRSATALHRTVQEVERTGATGVIIAATAMDLGTSNKLIRELVDRGIHVELSSTLRDIAAHRLTVRPLGRFPVVYVEPVQRGGWRMLAKRALDVSLASLALLIASPVIAIVALLIKREDGGPILFKQERIGRNGVPFKCWKFRTMCIDAEAKLAALLAQNERNGPLFKMENDPRITKVGGVLRKLSIDEIPQLVNVLKNEMSMVGPRPALKREMDEWPEDLHGRLRVKPGLTGMWQVQGRGLDSTFEDYERLDLYYVDNWSLATDLSIIAKTIPALVFSKDAV
jgi:exopolysaccharide biosynthesis polyprenyl glycosylphosphotransferase